MRSAVAHQLCRERRKRLAALSPAERVALALRLSDEGLTSYMATHAVDRQTAIARIKATRRIGRRRSVSADADDR
jgi:hypothetical protein